ncbi:hypothetical protein HDU87_003615 [Geranomyces variabilis]|uniref:Zn(2)-C6 fungal-type domain-containing protein n=1 Tax=Geranomyces variabilis TaxID=109894 RepID=A0AAD5TJE8_9FUNG|nr:hypothetical protein HDU87_003615 [Geranomyces variabilis]
MHRAFFGLRPAFGLGRDYMGADGMSKAAVLLGGMNNGPADDIVDPFLGSDAQTVSPPQLRIPATTPGRLSSHAPTPFATPKPCPPFPRRSVDYSSLTTSSTSTTAYRQPTQPHPPTPISTLLAFKRQVRSDASLGLTSPIAAITPSSVITPITPPQDECMDVLLSDDFDFVRELEALENISFAAQSIGQDSDAFFPEQQQQPHAADKWMQSPKIEPANESAAMINAQQQLPQTIPGGLAALHTPAPAAAAPRPQVAARAHAPHTAKPISQHPRTKSYVHKACVSCKTSHVACDVTRPCQRCVRSGKADSCIDAERKKRGRPTTSHNVSGPPKAASASFRPKKRVRQTPAPVAAAAAEAPDVSPPSSFAPPAPYNNNNALTPELSAQLLSALIPLQTTFGGPLGLGFSSDGLSPSFMKQELFSGMSPQSDSSADMERAVADAATALLNGLNDFGSSSPDMQGLMEDYDQQSSMDIDLDMIKEEYPSPYLFGDAMLLPPQVVTQGELMGGVMHM